MEQEVKELNKGKRGRPYKYSEGLFKFLGYVYAFVRNYRIIEGMCRAFNKIIKGFPVPDHSTIHRRLKASVQKVEVVNNVLIVDSTGWEEQQSILSIAMG